MCVRYLPAAMLFAFFNERGDLVGFDIELAHRLARELSPWRWRPTDAIGDDALLMGIAISRCRAFWSLLCAREMVLQFISTKPLRSSCRISSKSPTSSSPGTRSAKTRRHHDPRARRAWYGVPSSKSVSSYHSLLPIADAKVDAVALPAERGSARTLMFPRTCGRAWPRSDPRAARVSDRQTRRSGLVCFSRRQHLDRAEAQGWHRLHGEQYSDSGRTPRRATAHAGPLFATFCTGFVANSRWSEQTRCSSPSTSS